jgi:hypothetical protein
MIIVKEKKTQEASNSQPINELDGLLNTLMGAGRLGKASLKTKSGIVSSLYNGLVYNGGDGLFLPKLMLRKDTDQFIQWDWANVKSFKQVGSVSVVITFADAILYIN